MKKGRQIMVLVRGMVSSSSKPLTLNSRANMSMRGTQRVGHGDGQGRPQQGGPRRLMLLTFAGSNDVQARVPGNGGKRAVFSPVEIASHTLMHWGR